MSTTPSKPFHSLYHLLFLLSFLSSISFIYHSTTINPPQNTTTSSSSSTTTTNLLSFHPSWNHLSFSPNPPPRHLKIALFVKRWPQTHISGGLERHALTLHLSLANRGHQIHIFTTNSSSPPHPNPLLSFHLTPPSPNGYLNQALAWTQFELQNSTGPPFDIVHTESVGLYHCRAKNVARLAVTWHGIAYESIHSDIVEDLLRKPDEPRGSAFSGKIGKVVEEVRFFRRYAHHVATSDHVGDVLRRVYLIPEDRVHVILNGVDESVFKPRPLSRERFRRKFGVPKNAQIVVGMAGRLVRDKGHPLMFECLKQVFSEDLGFKKNVFFLVAGDGPWANRYRDLGQNLIFVGSLNQTMLSEFYNSLDVFLNPTLRAQGLDHTFAEAMLSGLPVMGTRFASIAGSIIVSSEVGYLFQPTVESLKESIFKVFRDGKDVLGRKGEKARNRAIRLFTASKMSAAYERLFLCITDSYYCKYPIPGEEDKSMKNMAPFD